MAKTKNEVAKVETTAVATGLAAMMARDSGSGMEGTDRDSFAIPFLRALQQLSPQCVPGKTGYNPKAKAGMLFNTVTGELYPDGLTILPCAYQRRFLQWAPRGSNGGYRGEHLPEDVAERLSKVPSDLVRGEDGKIYIGEANPKKSDYLADTRNHFVLILTENGPVQALLSLTSTQIKKSKQLMGILSSVKIGGKTPPTWMNRIKVTTTLESNDQGSWHGVVFEADGFIESEELYLAGKNFHDTIMAGAAKVVYTEPSADGDGEWGEKN